MKAQDSKKGVAVKVVHGYYTGRVGTLVRRERINPHYWIDTIMTEDGKIRVGNGNVQPAKARRSSYAR